MVWYEQVCMYEHKSEHKSKHKRKCQYVYVCM